MSSAAPPGLEDLKGSVDTLRTNMWAILSAGPGAASRRPDGATAVMAARSTVAAVNNHDALVSCADWQTTHPRAHMCCNGRVMTILQRSGLSS